MLKLQTPFGKSGTLSTQARLGSYWLLNGVVDRWGQFVHDKGMTVSYIVR